MSGAPIAMRGARYGTPDPELDPPVVNERRMRLGDLLERATS